MLYLLDTDVFISAKNEHYGFDLCPGFWEWLEKSNAAGTVHSVEAVYHELIGGGDDLAQWARNHRSFFLPSATSRQIYRKASPRASDRTGQTRPDGKTPTV